MPTPPAPETIGQAVPPAPEPGIERPEDLQTEERKKTDREVFDAILAKHKGEADAPAAPPEPITEEKPQPDGQAPTSETPEPKAEKPSEPPKEVAAAKQFLALKTRVPQAVLDGLSATEALAWAEERRERESTVDAAFARAKRAETEFEARAASDQATDEGEPIEPTPDPDLRVATKALAEELALTDDGRARLDDVLEKAMAPLKEKLSAIEARGATQEQRQKLTILETARSQAGERFPDLSDDEVFQAVLTDAAALENSPTYAGRPPEEYLPELLESVARGRRLSEVDKEAAESERVAAVAETDRAERLAADAGPLTSRPTESRQKTKAEQDWDVYQAIRGKSKGRAG